MAHSNVSGKNFKTEGTSITIMDLPGSPSGNYWSMGIRVSEENADHILVVDRKCPVLKDIVKVIESDRTNGDFDEIKMVVVCSRVAVRLWLEGILTKGHFMMATEGSVERKVTGQGLTDIPYIVIPAVELGNSTFPLAIVPEMYVGADHICTVNSQNMIVGEGGEEHPLLPEPEELQLRLQSGQ